MVWVLRQAIMVLPKASRELRYFSASRPIRPADGVYNAKLSISFTSQSRERDCLFLPALNGSCMTSCCISCLFVPLFLFSQGLNVVYFFSVPNRPSRPSSSVLSPESHPLGHAPDQGFLVQ